MQLAEDFGATFRHQESSPALCEYAIDLIEFGQETRTLDYKGPLRWSEKDKKSCCDLTKDILAMANTAGGAIVIGVAERQNRFVLEGLDPNDAVTWETTRLNNFINRYADPPVNCQLLVVEHKDRHFVIISVPVFSFTPHITIRDYPESLSRATLYVRSANNASAPIENSADFNSLVERAIKVRRGDMLEAILVILPELEAALATRPNIHAEGIESDRLMRRVSRAISVLRGSQVLWIDDHPENNIHERRMLRSLGVFVDLARTSKSAESLLRETDYDLVISDIARGRSNKEGLRFLRDRLSDRSSPATILYIGSLDESLGTPPGAFAITDRPDELLHYVIDALERVRS